VRFAGAGAFLALWNGIADARLQPEYEAWHALEHVPERVGTPGFAWASRFTAVPGAHKQPAYFTLYALESVTPLMSPRYQELIDHPTPWSARMRGVLTDFCREPCETLSTHGISAAGVVATLRMRVDSRSRMQEQLDGLIGSGKAVAAFWGRLDTRSRHPLATDETATEAGPAFDAVVLLQHLREPALRAAVAKLQTALGPAASLRAPASFYEFQSFVHQADLPNAPGVRQLPRPDLQQQFSEGDITP
jgi:hypothetical protein